MGRYSVPPEIRAKRPDGTIVKKTDGHFYVYETGTRKGADGRWHTKTGSCIGRIDEVRGYLPNDRALRCQEWRTPGFGQWAVADDLSRDTRALLGEFLDADDADRIYVTALFHFVEGVTYMKEVEDLYEESVLQLRYPGLRLGYDALATLYDDLGRRDGPVLELQRALSERCSGRVAIDGHVVGSGPGRNDLASKGHEFRKIGEPQVNLIMALDAGWRFALRSRK